MPYDVARDASPLTLAQMRALLGGATRELTSIGPIAADELAAWRDRARSISDPTLRDDALDALDRKRGHADGAAFCALLAAGRQEQLVRTLVAYELILDYLDGVHERHPTAANGQQLHRALEDALDPTSPQRDYYRFHPRRDDDGYLLTLVEACRSGCAALPSYALVRTHLLELARRLRVLGLNHCPDPVLRDATLRRWAEAHPTGHGRLSWFEVTAASSNTLLIHLLLALASDPLLLPDEVARTHRAYWPFTLLAGTMLDSYVDLADDRVNGDHSYFGHYATCAEGAARLAHCIERSLCSVASLRSRHDHRIIIGCMIALYLSKTSANHPDLRDTTRALARSGGSLVRLLVPILRIWRRVHRQSS